MLPRDGHLCGSEETATAVSLHTSHALPSGKAPCSCAMWTRRQSQLPGPSPTGIQDQPSALHQGGGCCPSPQHGIFNSGAPSSFHSPEESLYTREFGIFLHLCPNLSDVALHHGVCQCKRSSFKLEQSSEVICLRIPALTSLELTVSTQHTVSSQLAHS